MQRTTTRTFNSPPSASARLVLYIFLRLIIDSHFLPSAARSERKRPRWKKRMTLMMGTSTFYSNVVYSLVMPAPDFISCTAQPDLERIRGS